MTKEKLILLSVLLLVRMLSTAQETLSKENNRERDSVVALYNKKYADLPFMHRHWAFFFTYSDFDFGEVNNFLESSGMPTVQDGLRSLPVFYYTENLYRKKLYFDVYIGWRNSGTKGNDDYSVKQNIFYYDLGFRYVLLNKKDHNLSLGAFVGRANYTINIDNMLENQKSDRIHKRDRHVGFRVLYTLIGSWHLTAGYRFNIENNERVSLNGHRYSDSPKLSAEGLFFGIGIGI